jgi:hypothetical protein
MGVLVNRPLNAMGPRAGGRLVRLADPPRPGQPGSDERLAERIAALEKLEADLADRFPGVNGPHIARIVTARWQELRTPTGLSQVFRAEIGPEARRGLGAVMAAVQGRPSAEQAAAVRQYQEELNELLDRIQGRAQGPDPRIAQAIRTRLAPHLPPELRDESLSRIALDFVVSTPGVTCALNGMRDPSYVADAVGVMTLPPIPDVEAVEQALP